MTPEAFQRAQTWLSYNGQVQALLERRNLSRFCSTRLLPTHEPFGAVPSARTPFHAGVVRAESAQGDSVAAGALQGLTRYVSGPVCVRMCAL